MAALFKKSKRIRPALETAPVFFFLLSLSDDHEDKITDS